MPDGHSHSEYRHKSLESGVMRKYHAPFGGRPTEKGSIQSTSPAAHPTSSPLGVTRPCRNGVRPRHPGVPWYGLATEAPSPPGALTNAVRQGDEWATYVTLGRTTGAKHGIAYGREPMATEPP